MSYATRMRAPSVFRDGALKVMDHARHLAIYLKVVATLREQKAEVSKLQVAWLAYVAAMRDRKACFFCDKERSAKIAKAALLGQVKQQTTRAKVQKSQPKPAVATEPQTAAEQKQRDEQFADYNSTPAMQGPQVYVQKAD